MLLNCHTYYSYKYGALSIDELLAIAKKMGHECIALTDINSTSACINFIRAAPLHGIKPVVGIDFRNGAQQRYVGIARNNEGFRELNEHLTYHSHNGLPFADRAPAFQHAYVIYKRGAVPVNVLRDNEYIGVSCKTVNKLLFANKLEEQHKWVFLQSASFIEKKHFNAHRLLRAIDNNTLLSKLDQSEQGDEGDVFRSPDSLREVFAQYPTVLANTLQILDDCSITMEFGKQQNKKWLYGVTEDVEMLRNEAIKGLEYRFGKKPPSNVIARMETELAVIKQMDFSTYFLINWDMVNYARYKGYFYIGRGSGANSLVAYLMRITDVDPIELDLYFERFINPFRKTPPDFDIDFSWTDREDVTRYLFDKYTWKYTALVGAYSTFQSNSVIRELGKVFGLPAHEIDALQEVRKGNYRPDKLGQSVLRYAGLIAGFPSHLTVHSSGIIISEEPISCYTATMLPPKGFPTTHFSMLESEDIGLHKYDVLGQRGLAKIKDAVQLIKDNRGVEVDIHDIPKFKQDKKVQSMLREGKAIGCFYVESPAMRMLLTKLKAYDYVGLVAASSIIRPGVAKSGMMREYILRFQDEERRNKARAELPELYDILAGTYGVMVYQEDVLKVAHIFGELTLAEADVLRRGMNWKYQAREEFNSVQQKFFDNCVRKGHAPEVVQAIWKQIESFANFAFAKGHSASYAVESFQALYLKAHFPLEYMVATTNNGGGFYSVELYIHELRMHGAEVEAPCINNSGRENTISGFTVWLGFGLISQLEEQVVASTLEERKRKGSFTGLRNFIERVPISLEQLIPLIRIGAFRFSGVAVKELLWEAHIQLNRHRKRNTLPSLFNHETRKFTLPALWVHPLEDSYAQMELLGFPLEPPVTLLKDPITHPLLAGHLPFKVGQQIEIIGYLVHRKRTDTSGGQKMYFGTWLDLDGEWLDTVHFPIPAAQFPFTGPGCYRIRGKVMEEFGFICIELESMSRLPYRSLDDADVQVSHHVEVSTSISVNQSQ